MKRPALRDYDVTVGTLPKIRVQARSQGHAARQVFRLLIAIHKKVGSRARKGLKRQPETDPEGGWKDTSIALVGAP